MIKREIIEINYQIYISSILDQGKERSIPFFGWRGWWSNMYNTVFKVKFDKNKFIIKLNLILFF